MRILTTILCMSFIFSGELEVEGDLKVTGTIENDALQQVISNLEAQIQMLQSQITILQNQLGIIEDCNGVIGGTAFFDPCGICIEEYSFDSCQVAVDIEGNIYDLVVIGDQVWMQENLRTMTFNNGNSIPTYANDIWPSLESPGAYQVNSDYTDTYGSYYNWYVVSDEEDVCPNGTRIPTTEDFDSLISYLGSSSSGGQMKTSGFDHWESPNTGANNESDFSGRGAGYRRSDDAEFWDFKRSTYFWTVNPGSEQTSHAYGLNYNNQSIISGGGFDNNYGFSVRCIVDE